MIRRLILFLVLGVLLVGCASAAETYTWSQISTFSEFDNLTQDKGSGYITHGFFADDFNDSSTSGWTGLTYSDNGTMRAAGTSAYICPIAPYSGVLPPDFCIYSDAKSTTGRPQVCFGGSGYSTSVGSGGWPGNYWLQTQGYDTLGQTSATEKPVSDVWFSIRQDVVQYNDTHKNVSIVGNGSLRSSAYSSFTGNYIGLKSYGGSNVTYFDNFRAYNPHSLTGTISTSVIDSGLTGRPTNVRLYRIDPPGTTNTVKIELRSSNDNETFSEWATLTTNAENATSYNVVDAERYYQVRINSTISDVHNPIKIIDLEVEQYLNEDLITLEYTSVTPPYSHNYMFVGNTEDFSLPTSKTATTVWYVNGVIQETDSSTRTAAYTIQITDPIEYNVTAFTTSGTEELSQTWMLDGLARPSGTISYNSFDQKIIVTDSSGVNLPQISASLQNPDAISNNGTVYTLESIFLTNSTLYVNSSTCTELKLTGDRFSPGTSIMASSGSYVSLADTMLSGWNSDASSYSRGTGVVNLRGLTASNVTFNYLDIDIYSQSGQIDGINCYECNAVEIPTASDMVLSNIYMKNSYPVGGGAAFLVRDSTNVSVDGIYVDTTKTVSSCINIQNSTLCTSKNLTTINAGGYLDSGLPGTGSYGVRMTGSHNHIENVSVNGSRWSGIAAGGDYITWENITIKNAGHNGWDKHGGNHAYVNGIYISDSHDIELLITSGYNSNPSVDNTTIDGFVTGVGGTSSIVIDQNITSCVLKNGTFAGTATTWTGNYTSPGANDVRLINVTGNSFQYWFYLDQTAHTGAVIDSRLTTIGRYLPANPFYEEIVTFGNTLGALTGYSKQNMSISYYPNIIVKNATGYTVEDAVITFESDNPIIPVWDANGDKHNNYITTRYGTLESDNRSNRPLITKYYYNPSQVKSEPTWTVTATKEAATTSETLYQSSLVYTSTPTDFEGDETVLILDVMGVINPPTCEFSATPRAGLFPLTVQFTDLSENALSWYWDFNNDGTVDNTTQNPIYTYDTAGTYSVNLTVQNVDGSDSEVKELYISVESPSIITSYWNSFWAWWGMRWQVTYWLEEAV